jgi:RNA polymerase sigma-70 factor (ECF subfamily)
MRLLGNLSFAQIGEVLGISEVSARVAFYRAQQKLAACIKKELE